MKSKLACLLLLLPILFSFTGMPDVLAKAEEGAFDGIYQTDRQLLNQQNTMKFFESVARKKGDEKLAQQIATKAAALAEKNKALHVAPKAAGRMAQRAAIMKHLHGQKGKLEQLQADYEQQIAAYWKLLLPSFSAEAAPSSLLPRMAAFTATGAVVDPFEPNDSESQSYPITVGNLYDSKLSSSTDQDFYQFQSGTLTGSLTVTLTNPADKDYDLIVMEAPSNVVGFSIYEKLGGTETVTFQVKPNTTYYIGVFSFNRHFSTTDYYHLSLSKVTAVLSLASPIDISLPVGEVPAYRFTAPVNGTYRFFTSPYGGFGAPFDTILVIFADEQMRQLVGFNDEAQDGLLFSEMKVPMTQGETYFVYVSDGQETGVHARLTVALDASAKAASPVIHESAANDGSIEETQVISLSNGTFATDVANGVTVKGLPAGLTPVITRNSDTQITLKFAGKAVNHESKHHVEGVTATISKDKVPGAVADLVTNPFGFVFTDTDGIVVSTPQDMNLGAGQSKILKLTAPFSGPYEIATTYYGGAAGEGTSNTVLGLYEDYGQTRQLAFNDDGDHPPFSRLTPSLKSGQDYYIVLSGAGGGSVHARLSVRYLGVEYVYNAKGQLISTRQNGKVLTEWQYDGNGNVIRKIVHE
ncbi:hypothetical protein [Brevibacillus brevis]|uniref:Uncharacterized protein n=1 Tax=Brevibacillus brevis TaxID=1393 RepID=A0ABY9T2E6_BREBE|nr:hypothetical protein [Brevibacillus brevis]WNC14285.1 hypothetical protein RGB73_27005 [Brevibacillus brevis]